MKTDLEIIIRGKPGTGKSTIKQIIAQSLREHGYITDEDGYKSEYEEEKLGVNSK